MTTCTITMSLTKKYVVIAGVDHTVTALKVETHSGGQEQGIIWLEGRPVTTGVEDAVRLFDRFPGHRVVLTRGREECDNAEHYDLQDVPDDEERARLDAAFGGGRQERQQMGVTY